jgi:hypothetical protein
MTSVAARVALRRGRVKRRHRRVGEGARKAVDETGFGTPLVEPGRAKSRRPP